MLEKKVRSRAATPSIRASPYSRSRAMPNVMSWQCVALPYGRIPPSRYSGSGDTQRPDLQRAALLYALCVLGSALVDSLWRGWSRLRWLGMGFEIL